MEFIIGIRRRMVSSYLLQRPRSLFDAVKDLRACGYISAEEANQYLVALSTDDQTPTEHSDRPSMGRARVNAERGSRRIAS